MRHVFAILVASGSFASGAFAQSCGSWSQSAAIGPGSRTNPALAYDSVRQRTVLFGGGSNETWEYDGVAWSRVFASPPGIDFGHAMAFDTSRQRCVLAGSNQGNPAFETWEWNGSAWSQVAAFGLPGRYAHAVAYDTSRARLVLFGGASTVSGGGILGDTWEWNGSVWIQRANTGPSPRFRHAMAYDSQRQRVVLFGGMGPTGTESLLGDTWEWDGVAWTAAQNNGPLPRFGHAFAFDSVRNRCVLIGGFAGPSVHLSAMSDTWEWDGYAWHYRPIASPSPREDQMVYDVARQRAVLFKGSNGPVQTWELSVPASAAIQQQPQSVNAAIGSSVSFSITTTGGPLSYQWRRNAQPLANGGNIAGATAPTLSISAIGATDAGAYDCIVANTCGSVRSDPAILNVQACYPNCDGSTQLPILNVADFTCFLQRFAAGCP